MKKSAVSVAKKWQVIFSVSLILSVIAFLIFTIFTPKYRSDSMVLVVQKDVDTLVASENAEYLSKFFERILYTDSFMRNVLKADNVSVVRQFSRDIETRKKEWKEEIRVEAVEGTGIIKLSVFDRKREDVHKIAVGILRILQQSSVDYFGKKELIEIRVIDGPITSTKAVYPHIALRTLLVFMVATFGSWLVYALGGNSWITKIIRRRKPVLTEENIIKQQVEEQLVRQLKKRTERDSLEYLDEQLDKQGEFMVPQKKTGPKLDQSELSGEPVAAVKDTKESEHINISKEKLIDKRPESQDLEIQKIKQEEEEVIEIFKTPEQNEDDLQDNLDQVKNVQLKATDSKDNFLLANSMVDMDTYYKIIRAGETFQGFKTLKEKGQLEGVVAINTKEDAKKSQNRSKKAGQQSRQPLAAKSKPVDTKKASDKGIAIKKRSQETREELELSVVGLKEILRRQQEQFQETEPKNLKESIVATKDKVQVIKSPEKKQKIAGIKTEKTADLKNQHKGRPVQTDKPKSSKSMTNKKVAKLETEEDFEKIAKKRKEQEKAEIKQVLAEEAVQSQKLSADKQKKTELELIKGVEIQGQKQDTQIDKRTELKDELLEVDSINFVGSVEEDKELELGAKSKPADSAVVVKGSQKAGVLAKLYKKSLFKDKKFQRQREERVDHHLEMDPEELEMMRKMLQAEGKSEAEFAAENGFVVQSVTKDALDQEGKQFPEQVAVGSVQESVKKLETPVDTAGRGNKKAEAPANLPVFMEQESEQDTFARKLLKPEKQIDPIREVSEDEIKERLNRLLQGEL